MSTEQKPAETEKASMARNIISAIGVLALMSVFPVAAILSATGYAGHWNARNILFEVSMVSGAFTIIYGVGVVFLALPHRPLYVFGIVAALSAFIGAVFA